jgi:ATP-binding protein involved in chromosome partitioning
MGLFSKNNSTISESDILTALRGVEDPDLHKDVVSLGMIKDVKIDGNNVSFTFELTTPSCPLKDQLEASARSAVGAISGIGDIKINMSANVATHTGANKPAALSQVRNTIAVASGKGGVGKSTVAANLAVALAKDGAKVGLLDADIYGPSIPLMFGLENEKPEAQQVNGHALIQPLEAFGVKVMSIGFLVDPNTAVVWRGPMASGALKQFMTDVQWGELDYLIFDLPPGTGDIQLTLCQTIPLTGAVIVSTPQDVALADARKAVRMFEKVHVPVLGLVENMSYYNCSACGHREEIFAHGGGKLAAAEFGIPFLGELPLETNVRQAGDAGKPIVASAPFTPAASAFGEFSQAVAQQVSIRDLMPSQKPVEILLGMED